MPLPSHDTLDLVKYQVNLIISADLGPVYRQNFCKGIVKQRKVRLIEIDKENFFCRNPLVTDEVIDLPVVQGERNSTTICFKGQEPVFRQRILKNFRIIIADG